MPFVGRRDARGVAAAVLALLASLGCGSTITSPPQPLPLLDPNQPRSQDSTVTVTAAGVDPQVLHVDSPVTVKFVNNDQAAHRFEAAPELGQGDCPEMSQLGALQPGQSGSVTITRSVIICGYHDSGMPTNMNFKGLVVVH